MAGAPVGDRRLLWALALATGLPLTAVGAPNVALPAIAQDLGASFDQQQWVIAVYGILLAALQFSSGPIADRLGRRRTCLTGLLVFSLASALAGIAPSMIVLIVARGLQGVGGALVITGALALMAAETAAEDRLRAVALRSAVIAVSFAIGPLMGGLLVDGPGWRGLFAVDALVALPLAWVLLRPRPEPPPGVAAAADWPGLAILTAGLLAGVAAIIRSNDDGWTSPRILAMSGACAVAIAIFAARDRRSGAPLLPARLVRNRVFLAMTFGLAGLYFAIFGGMVYLTRYLLVVQGRSATASGLILVPFAAASLLSVIAITRYRGGLSQRAVVALAFFAGALGMWTLRDLQPHTSLWALMPGLVLLGIASGVVNPTFTAGHLSSFSRRDGGIAASVNSSARQLGTALGTAVLGAVVQHGSAVGVVTVAFPVRLSGAIGDALLLGGAVLAALALVSLRWLPAEPLPRG